MRCDQCEMLSINGVACHETGCPNARKRFVDGEWVKVYRCRECGTEALDADSAGACCAPIEEADEPWPDDWPGKMRVQSASARVRKRRQP